MNSESARLWIRRYGIKIQKSSAPVLLIVLTWWLPMANRSEHNKGIGSEAWSGHRIAARPRWWNL